MKKIFVTLLTLVLLSSLAFASGSKEDAAKVDAVFRLYNGAEPESLDPALISGVPERRIVNELFEGLVKEDPKTSDPLPGMAKSWDVSEDGMTYTFHLRDAVWSDGVPVTAKDFEWSILRVLAPETAASYAWFPAMFLEGADAYNSKKGPAEAVGVKALDDKTLELKLVGPLPYVLGALTHYSFFAVPRHAIEKYGEKWIQVENFVGNGAFVLSDWKPQSYIDVVPSSTYYDAKSVKLSKIRYYAIEDNTTAYNMYLNGEIDWLTTVPNENIESASLRDDYQIAPQLSVYYYVLQNEKAPTNNPLVRKALARGFDRQALVDKVTKAGQLPAWGIVPDMSGYAALTTDDNNVAAAKDYLAQAGYPNGAGFPTLSILYNTSEGHKAIAEFLQQEWKNNLGINVELNNQEWKTYLATRRAGDFEIARVGWVGDYQDPNTFLDMFVTGTAMNGGRYSNPKYDALIAKAATMPAGSERLAVLAEAENLLINEDQGLIPFYYYTSNNLIDLNKWGGWYSNTMDTHPLRTLYLK